MDQTPPLPALRVFEAAARHLSFTAAAAELGMTQAAVSYQIRVLEDRLGSALFLRKPRGVELTALGARLARPTHAAFAQLRDAWRPDQRGDMLTISTLTTLAGSWLSQRLGIFQMANPNVAVRLDTSDTLVDFNRDDVDVAIRHGRGDWPGVTAHHLFDMTFAPMMSPTMAEGVTTAEEVFALPWLDPSDPNWPIWLAAAGVDHALCASRPGLILGTQTHEARAAIAGSGVALLTPRFFQVELATGALVQPVPTVASGGTAYWLVYPPARRNRPAIRAFRRFLTEQIAADAASV